jgi:hypothetical protein
MQPTADCGFCCPRYFPRYEYALDELTSRRLTGYELFFVQLGLNSSNLLHLIGLAKPSQPQSDRLQLKGFEEARISYKKRNTCSLLWIPKDHRLINAE